MLISLPDPRALAAVIQGMFFDENRNAKVLANEINSPGSEIFYPPETEHEKLLDVVRSHYFTQHFAAASGRGKHSASSDGLRSHDL